MTHQSQFPRAYSPGENIKPHFISPLNYYVHIMEKFMLVFTSLQYFFAIIEIPLYPGKFFSYFYFLLH